MEGLYTFQDLIQSQDWMVKLDLKNAYLQVQIHQDHQCFLQIQREQKPVCMPAHQANISTTGFYKINEVSGGGFEAYGDLLHSIPGRYPNTTSREGRIGTPYSFGVSDV